jgi:hypothetical protein
MPASFITASKSESVGENAGEPARAWRPRHVHVRLLKGGCNGRAPHPPPTCGKCQTCYSGATSAFSSKPRPSPPQHSMFTVGVATVR